MFRPAKRSYVGPYVPVVGLAPGDPPAAASRAAASKSSTRERLPGWRAGTLCGCALPHPHSSVLSVDDGPAGVLAFVGSIGAGSRAP